MESRERDEFQRMKLHNDIAKVREHITQYERGLSWHRKEVEEQMRQLGRIEERLGEPE